MKLEDLRKDNIGQIYAWFPKRGNELAEIADALVQLQEVESESVQQVSQ